MGGALLSKLGFSRSSGSQASINKIEENHLKKVVSVHEVRPEDLKKVAGPPPSRECSTDHACEMEDIEIRGLDKLKEMDENHTKQNNITSETFEKYWSSINKNSKMLQLLEIPTFADERGKVTEAFKGKDIHKKEEAMAEYKKAVVDCLNQVAKKNSQQEKEEPVAIKK